ncbi:MULTISPECIES: TraB/GumN family protein [unclassified Iodidimonas]|jgi:uncharacterized protein YbaP (TraB family)|uniref:TraB/GumN family protein n=1 Tax=unclassified Iodidimonas TaxID=2626145 RepID=UPI00248249E0|nr:MULTISPECIES: TraB/GumN family protein [unclassified Iodidimonas]
MQILRSLSALTDGFSPRNSLKRLARIATGVLAFVALSMATAQAQAQDQVPHAPAIWTMADDDSTVYFLGTIHLLKADTPWQSETITDIINEATSLTLELTPQDMASPKMQSLVQSLGFYGPDDQLSNHLPEESYTRLAAAFQKRGIPTQAMDRLKPWMAGLQITVVSAMQAGFMPQFGVDHLLGQIATQRGIEIAGLEKPEDQLRLFADLSDEAQAAFIREGLDQIDDLEGYFERLKEAWLTADLDSLNELMTDGLEENPELADKLLYTRNRNWLPAIEALLDQPGTHLVAVGAGHLVGTQSVIDLLQDKGHQVDRY